VLEELEDLRNGFYPVKNPCIDIAINEREKRCETQLVNLYRVVPKLLFHESPLRHIHALHIRILEAKSNNGSSLFVSLDLENSTQELSFEENVAL
jgi:hypothetical protein